jgi:phosphosulfolactate phosphohydrolase-like enzyme
MLNRQVMADRINREQPECLLLVCSGTKDQSALEDVLGAGALCESIGATYSDEQLSDAAAMAREVYRAAKNHLVPAIHRTQNGRRLAAIPELEPDLKSCAQLDTLYCLAARQKNGTIRRIS